MENPAILRPMKNKDNHTQNKGLLNQVLWSGLAGFICGLFSLIAIAFVFRHWPSEDFTGLKMLRKTLISAAFFTGSILWWLLVSRAKTITLKRGFWVGALIGLASLIVASYLRILYASFFPGWHLRSLPQIVLGGLVSALTNAILFGWITIPIGGLVGAFFALVQSRRLIEEMRVNKWILKRVKMLFFIIIGAIFFLITCIHSDGPYRGKVVEFETGNPIEGSVIAASWTIPILGHLEILCDLKETVTDKNGEFELSRGWCINHPLAKIYKPNVIVFKPGYAAAEGWAFYSGTPQSIFAIGPSTIGYLGSGYEIVNGQIIQTGSKKIKTYPEGLILTGKVCQERIKSIKESTPFMIEAFFVPLEEARERIKKLDILLDCSKDGEPVPSVDETYNFRNDIEKHIKKSYVVVSLPKLKTREEQIDALHDAESLFTFNKALIKLPVLLKLTNEENKKLGFSERSAK